METDDDDAIIRGVHASDRVVNIKLIQQEAVTIECMVALE
jgi:hypothetical protein